VKRALRAYGRFVAAILFLALLATASGTYILINQRLSTPLQDRYTIYADLPSSSGLTPGLGQAVNVAGVRVGQISGARLVNGIARISLEIDPHKLPRVYGNSTAALVPNTPLKDMLLELGPGGPPSKPLPDGGIIPVSRTDPPIDSDELTSALDADTRDFLQLLVADAATGTRGRGGAVNQLFKALQPTTRQLGEVAAALAGRRHELKRLVGNLAILTDAAGAKDKQLARVVATANATLQAVSSQDGALGSSLDKLPRTLSSIRSSLGDVQRFADELTPTLDRLLPATRRLPAALHQLDPLLTTAQPILRDRIRPLVRRLDPVARDLRPTTTNLIKVTPDLSQAFKVLTYVVNETSYNPPGDNEGFLFWTAWFAHNAASMLSTQDANGAMFRGLVLTSCDSITAQPDLGALLEIAFGAVTACDDK
jgi:phospholipid/cholesterol/gamma-HCH transport system substrate-binding protein